MHFRVLSRKAFVLYAIFEERDFVLLAKFTKGDFLHHAKTCGGFVHPYKNEKCAGRFCQERFCLPTRKPKSALYQDGLACMNVRAQKIKNILGESSPSILLRCVLK